GDLLAEFGDTTTQVVLLEQDGWSGGHGVSVVGPVIERMGSVPRWRGSASQARSRTRASALVSRAPEPGVTGGRRTSRGGATRPDRGGRPSAPAPAAGTRAARSVAEASWPPRRPRPAPSPLRRHGRPAPPPRPAARPPREASPRDRSRDARRRPQPDP